MLIITFIDKNTVNNTIYSVHEAQSFDDVTVTILLWILSPSITLVHSSSILSTRLFLQSYST